MYEVIAGHYRLQAAKELGWKEIESTVKDIINKDADVLSLKTNIMHKNMEEIEEARIIKKLMDKYGLSQNEIAKKLGRSNTWVRSRLAIVLKVTKKVQSALADGLLSAEHVNLISNISEDIYENWEEKQNEFLNLILENKWSTDETRKQLKRFLNDTIFTIGYEGKNIDEFIKILNKNQIKRLVDIRFSAKSEKKPQFSSEILKEKLEREKIEYEHRPELGVPYLYQAPYKEGAISHDCFKQLYTWLIKTRLETEKGYNLEKFANYIKDQGKTILLCMEHYHKPIRDQKIFCHRHLLAEMLQEVENGKLFPKRIDL